MKIVSLVPSQTELLCDLGLQDSLVGITKFCVHPTNLRTQKVIVGGTKQVNFEKIHALKPDVILCNKEENTLEMVNVLRDIAPVHVADVTTLEDVYDLIHEYGEMFSCVKEAQQMVGKCKGCVKMANQGGRISIFKGCLLYMERSFGWWLEEIHLLIRCLEPMDL